MKRMNWKIRLGIGLILLSGVFFGLMLIFPFMNLEGKTKIALSTAALIAMEVSFWVGGLLVGKELFIKYKSYLNPKNWFKKKSEKVDTEKSLD
ncbi:MAG: transporter suffix domain-containing protein [Bacteroidales bacterium]|jgi:MFS-type transporter involved in bile tolerance (Atg22 family)|nr:transporter suffix domain-containing protein [Bacteroidales bacterium]